MATEIRVKLSDNILLVSEEEFDRAFSNAIRKYGAQGVQELLDLKMSDEKQFGTGAERVFEFLPKGAPDGAPRIRLSISMEEIDG